MKLLFLIHRLPCPPDRGAKLRAAIQLRRLAQRHQVWCAGFRDGPVEAAALAELRTSCQALFAVPLRRHRAAARALCAVLKGDTCTQGWFASSELERRVLDWAQDVQFDAVLAFSSGMAPLALAVPAGRHVLMMDDLDSEKWRERSRQSRAPLRWLYDTEARRLACLERRWIAGFDASVVVSRREGDLVTDPMLRSRVHVIDAGLTPSPACDEADDGGAAMLPDAPIVGFLGAMDYAPNVEAATWFADAIWPDILSRRADAEWWIVGRSPVHAVRRLAGRPRVRVTGTVPAVEPYLQRMRLHVAPLRLARGVQIKVLVAMAMGRPCVVTPCVAAGIDARAGEELIVAASPREFADAVLALLNDRPYAEAVGQAARAFIRRRHESDDGPARLERLLFPDLPTDVPAGPPVAPFAADAGAPPCERELAAVAP